MSRRAFGFVEDWCLDVYPRLYRYLQTTLNDLSIPFKRFGSINDVSQEMDKHENNGAQLLVFLPFDALCQRYKDTNQDIPSIYGVKFILIVSEPNGNLESAHGILSKHASLFYAILNFNLKQYIDVLPKAINFTCFQGYIPSPLSIKTIDFLVSQWSGRKEDRVKMASDLRKKGYSVSENNAEMDRARTVVCCSFDGRHDQGAFWALNHGCNVVAPTFCDLYAGLFSPNVEFHVDAFERYKRDFKNVDVITEEFYCFCKDWTS